MDNKLLCTDGDWGVIMNGIYVHSGDKEICKIDQSRNGNEIRANAHLIAASKDLYNALQIANEYLSHMKLKRAIGEIDKDLETIKKALQKANPNFRL